MLTPPNQAIEEIKAILKKHDLAGVAFVASTDELAFLKEISPSWSCARVEPQPGGGAVEIRIRSKREDYPTKEAQKASVEATTQIFLAIGNQAEHLAGDFARIVAMIARHFPNITHWERRNE